MVRRWGMIAAFILTLAMALPMIAQDKNNKDVAKTPDKAPQFYKLDLTVREMDGNKIVNTRNYTINQETNEYGRFRVGSRIPVPGNSGSTTQFQYIDVGLNADCHIIDSDPGPTLLWTIELSSVAPEPGAAGQPVIRNVRSQGQTLLMLNKPIVLSNTDDLSSTHRFVFEVTATKIQ